MINWGLAGGGNNALSMFQLGASLGSDIRERREQKEQRNALAAYATNPNEQTLAPVIQANPELGIQLRGQMARQAQQQQEQRRADLPLIGRLLDGIGDESTYQQRKAMAGQYGIDVSQLPQNFDPAWVAQQQQTIKLLSDPAKAEALSTAGKQAVDMGFRPGTPEFNAAVRDIWTAGEAKPYVSGGETRLYTPKIGGAGQVQGGPQVGAVEDGYRFKGGNPADPSAWEPVGQGGGGARVTSGFLDGL